MPRLGWKTKSFKKRGGKPDRRASQDGEPRSLSTIPACRSWVSVASIACGGVIAVLQLGIFLGARGEPAAVGASGLRGAAARAVPDELEEATEEVPRPQQEAVGSAVPRRRKGTTCTIIDGYANGRIRHPLDFRGLASAANCSTKCAEWPSCTCWSWKDDGFCRIGVADHCTYMGSVDEGRWKFGSCSRGPQVARKVRKSSPDHSDDPTLEECQTAAVVAAKLGTTRPPVTQIPVLVIAHARPHYLRRALASIFKQRRQAAKFPVTASQDGDDEGVTRMLQERLQSGDLARHLRFTPPAELVSRPGRSAMRKGYQRSTSHYRWALDQMLGGAGHEQLIVLEEDLEVAPDFFDYFEATLPVLVADPCLFCVSAWSDSGRPEVASNGRAVFRTDLFPGLGWMMLRTFWLEIRDRWPLEFWDDFIRQDGVRQGRHCLQPEVPRVRTFGEVGVSKGGRLYNTHLKHLALNAEQVDWKAMNLAYISSPGHFEEFLKREMAKAETLRLEEVAKVRSGGPANSTNITGASRTVVVRYMDAAWLRYARFFGLMEDSKAGVRRGSYHGVVPLTWRKHRVFLVRDWPLAKPLA